jgi:Putative bacterial sensory transduction regulator
MIRLLMTAVAIMAAVAPAALAQGEPNKNFTPADFEKVVVDELKKTFKKSEVPDGLFYDIEATPYYAIMNTKRKFIMFQIRMKSLMTPLETLNAWNKEALYSRAYRSDDLVVFEGAISYATGLSTQSLVSLYRNLDEESVRFLKLIRKGTGKP